MIILQNNQLINNSLSVGSFFSSPVSDGSCFFLSEIWAV